MVFGWIMVFGSNTHSKFERWQEHSWRPGRWEHFCSRLGLQICIPLKTCSATWRPSSYNTLPRLSSNSGAKCESASSTSPTTTWQNWQAQWGGGWDKSSILKAKRPSISCVSSLSQFVNKLPLTIKNAVFSMENSAFWWFLAQISSFSCLILQTKH